MCLCPPTPISPLTRLQEPAATPLGFGWCGGCTRPVCRAAGVQGRGQRTWRRTPRGLTLCGLSSLLCKMGSHTSIPKGRAVEGRSSVRLDLDLGSATCKLCLPGKAPSSLPSSDLLFCEKGGDNGMRSRRVTAQIQTQRVQSAWSVTRQTANAWKCSFSPSGWLVGAGDAKAKRPLSERMPLESSGDLLRGCMGRTQLLCSGSASPSPTVPC